MTQRHPPGRGSQLTPDDRREIQELKLIDGLTDSEISRRTGRDRGTVALVCRAEDTAALREQLAGERADEARRMLRNAAAKFAQNWIDASENGAKKGNHAAARDALYTLRVVDPPGDDRASNVSVHLHLNGGPEPLSLVANASPVMTVADRPPALIDGGTGGVGQENEKGAPCRPALIGPDNLKNSQSPQSETDSGCGIAPDVVGTSVGPSRNRSTDRHKAKVRFVQQRPERPGSGSQ